MIFMYKVLKFLLKIFCKIIFFVRVEGEENIPKEGAAILAVNHVSFWDPPVLISALKRPMRTMAKSELFKHK